MIRHAAILGLLVMLARFALAEGGKTAPGASDPRAARDLIETPTLPYLTLMVARDPATHAELGLSRRAVEQVDDAVAKIDHPMWALRDVPVAQCGEKLDAHLKQLRDDLSHVLTAAQLERLEQIIMQARGFKSLLSSDMAARLTLSADQAKQLRAIIGESARSKPSTNQASSTGSASTIEASTARKVLDVLSTEQSNEWARLLGKQFDLSRVRQIGCVAPELRGVDTWINGEPMTLASQRGKVVAVHFWAFGCINCVRNLPHYQGWYEKFPKSQLSIIGIHTPETERERVVDNLRASVQERGIAYPVAVDAAAENWKTWGNHMWPSVYLVDKQGRVRYWWYGELNWEGARGEEFLRTKIEALAAEK